MPDSVSKALFLSVLPMIALACLPGAPEAAVVDYFLIQYPSISPNGDGIRDASTVRIGLLETCTELLLTVEDRSTGAPLDTLLLVENASPGTYAAEWKGESSSGGLLADGLYTLRLFAMGALESANISRTVIVDLTAPLVALDRIEPGVYTPDLPGTAEKVLIYFSISNYGAGDTMRVTITSPLAVEHTVPVAISGDGAYRAEWSAAAGAVDGIYDVTLVIADEAGNSGADSGSVDVDTQGPVSTFITAVPKITNQAPLVIWGKCYDRNGIDNDSLSWDNSSYFPPDSTYMMGDTTLVWRFDVIDSLMKGTLYREGSHSLKVKCFDLLAHARKDTLSFILDVTPPGRATLNRLGEVVYEPYLAISGSVQQNTKYVFVYRAAGNDTDVTRKEIPATLSTFFVQDTLTLGENTIWAVAQDEAGNFSARSDVSTVMYEIAAGISHPEVFRGPDVFRIYTERFARKATVKIFTVAGELVATFLSAAPGTDFTFPWNLTNTDGEDVRNGPYLVVFTTTFDTGTTVEKRFIAVVR